MSNQTAEERRIYQRARTKLLKEVDEANRTPEIRELQKREGALQMKYKVARTPEERNEIWGRHAEVWNLLRAKIMQPPREEIEDDPMAIHRDDELKAMRSRQ